MLGLAICTAIALIPALLIPKRLFKADRLSGDWYGYATNQTGHAFVIGVIGTLALAVIYWTLIGVYPYRWQLFLAILLSYITFELRQGFSGWDTIEDTLFTVGYGAGGALMVTKADATETYLMVDANLTLVPLVLMGGHLAIGIMSRARGHDIG